MPQVNTNLAEVLTGAARNAWLALSEDQSRIVGRGMTVEEAVAEARKNGVDDPIVVWAPKSWSHAVFEACARE